MRRIVSLVSFLMALSILLWLGFWQLERLRWKESLIAQVALMKDRPAVDVPSAPQEFMKVKLSGRFMTEAQSYYYMVLPKPKGKSGGQGYFVITPMILPDGRIVPVNRGFIPIDKIPFNDSVVEGKLEGIIRFSERRSFFSAKDDLAKRVFYTRDSKAIYNALNLKGEAFFVDQTSEGDFPLPQVNEAVYSLPNNHLDYALTWFGLAFTLVGIFGIYNYRRRKKT